MAMTNAGFDGTVNEAQYAMMWAVGSDGDGVESAAAWAVTQGTGRQVSVAAQSGWAFSKGVLSKETVALTSALSTPTNGQFFLVERHVDWTSNAVTIVVHSGPTTSTTIPTVAPTDFTGVSGRTLTPGVVYDHALAWAWARSTDTTVVIFDLRQLPQDPTSGIMYQRVAGTWKPWDSVPIAFTPAVTGVTTSSSVATYQYMGGRLFIEGVITVSAAPTGGITVATPFPLVAPPDGESNMLGDAKFIDVGTTAFQGKVDQTAANVVRLLLQNAAGTYVQAANAGAAIPFTWASGDKIRYSYTLTV